MVPHSHLNHFVRRLGELVPLSAADQAALLGLPGQIVQVRASCDIVPAASSVDCAFIVLHGLVARFAQLKNGERQLTVLHIPGDASDLHTVPLPTPVTAIEALTTSTLLRISLSEIRSVAKANPAITEALWAYAAVDAAILARWAVSLARQNARSRMAHLLCEIGLRMERAGLGDRCNFELDMTQAQIGDALGLTPVHVNRTLQSLRGEGLVMTLHRRFAVKNWDLLCEIAEFDPTYLLIPVGELRAA